jgi:hypothetical protein
MNATSARRGRPASGRKTSTEYSRIRRQKLHEKFVRETVDKIINRMTTTDNIYGAQIDAQQRKWLRSKESWTAALRRQLIDDLMPRNKREIRSMEHDVTRILKNNRENQGVYPTGRESFRERLVQMSADGKRIIRYIEAEDATEEELDEAWEALGREREDIVGAIGGMSGQKGDSCHCLEELDGAQFENEEVSPELDWTLRQNIMIMSRDFRIAKCRQCKRQGMSLCGSTRAIARHIIYAHGRELGIPPTGMQAGFSHGRYRLGGGAKVTPSGAGPDA